MESKTYFFQPNGKVFKQGFFLSDESKNVVCEAKVIKQSLFSASEYEFVNHISNSSVVHKVGHTVTTEEGGGLSFLSTKSYFKFDGKNIWDYLRELSVRIDSSFSDREIGMSYSITLEGIDIGSIKTSSALTGKYCLDITTSDEYLDLLFLIGFAITRTEQTFYS